MVVRRMCCLLLAVAATCSLAGAAVETTTVAGKVLLPGGSGNFAQRGTIIATLSASGSVTDGSEVHRVASRVIATIASTGTVTGLVLVPNDVITPANTYYLVQFTVSAPLAASWTEKWSVTTSPDPVQIGNITRLDTPPPPPPLKVQQANVDKVSNPASFDFLDCAVNGVGNEAQISCPGTGGAPPFSAVTPGTNTTAAMVVGSGASLSVSGSGTIGATTAAALANNPTPCGSNLFVTDMAAAGTLTCTQPSFSNLSGTAAVSQLPDATTGAKGIVQLAGDLGGTAAAPSVGDDSHAHTGSTISGLDAANDIASGLLALARGGTNANLSATGGTGQYLKQASSGAAMTVGTIPAGDLPAGFVDAVADLASGLCADGEVLRKASGVWACLTDDDVPESGDLGVIDSSAEMASLVTDETGTGLLVFGTNPTIRATTGILGVPNSTTLPATCTVGDSYMDTDQTTGQRFYLCEATNTWVRQGDGTGGAGVWTDADPMVQSTTTRDVQIGAAQTNSAKLSVDGDADQVQLSIQAHSTQTSNVVVVENSAGTDQLVVTNNGNVTAAGTVTAGGIDTTDQTSSPGNRMRLRDNDVNLTPDPSCADCPAGEICLVDTDENAADRWEFCEGTTMRLRLPSGGTGGTAATVDGNQTFTFAVLDDDGVYFWEPDNPVTGLHMNVDSLTDFRLVTWPDFDMTPLSTAVQQTVTNKYLRDTSVIFQQNADTSKFLKFNLAGLSASSLRTVNWPDSDITPVGTTLAQTLSGKTLTEPVLTGQINFKTGTSVDDDDCTGDQGETWWDSTDNRFEWCDANSGTPDTASNYLPLAGGTLTGTVTTRALTAQNGYLWDLSAVDNSATTEGFILPQSTDPSTGTAEGQAGWDTNDERLGVGGGSSVYVGIGPGESVARYRQVGTSPERWYYGGIMMDLLGTPSAAVANTLKATAFMSGRGGTIDRIGVPVTTFATGNVRACIYDTTSDTNLYPNNLILDSGAIATGTSNGMKTATVSQALKPNTLYWFATVFDATPSTRDIGAYQTYAILGYDANTQATNTSGTGWSVTFTYAACPSTFTAGGSVVTTDIPAVGVRYSN